MTLQTTVLLLFQAFVFSNPTLAVPKNGSGFCDVSSFRGFYQTNWIDFPVDHFHNESRYEPHSDKTFRNRFWFDDTHYRVGGPVIVQNAGEASGRDEFPDLQIGLLHILTQATNGIGVLLEHRYYGHSHPVPLRNAKDWRFLSTEQAMADQAYFAQNVVFPGKEHLNLTAPNTPWFAIGCSYPGGLTAFERIQYPDLFWGALSSSGITAPKANNWEYNNVVREYSPKKCTSTFGKIINIADTILLSGNASQITQLKTFFNSTGATDLAFAESLQFWYTEQQHTWLPCLNYYDEFQTRFCQTLTAPTVLYPQTEKVKATAQAIIANGGWANETDTLTTAFLNYVGNTRASPAGGTSVPPAPKPPVFPGYDGVDEGEYWSWTYQMCSEWGLWLTDDEPANTLPIVSSLITLNDMTEVCRANLSQTGVPNSAGLDRYGRYNLSYPRLMLTGGEEDPWRPQTPLAVRDTPTRLDYPSTPEQPWVVIPKATHCWDWLGAYKSEEEPGVPPESIKRVHDMEKETFRRWLAEWHDAHPEYDAYV